MFARAKLLIVLLIQLLSALAAAAAVGAVPDHAVILMYHHVDESTPASTSVSPEIFEEHLDYLERNGYRIWSLTAVVDSLKEGAVLPDSVVAITFDDGYRSVYTEAFPRLQSRGWPFTVFVATEDIDQGNGPVLSWDDLREMAAAGATIASHAHRHRHLQRLDPEETRTGWRARTQTELLQSRQRILDEIGQDAAMIAYPYGEYDEQVLEIVRDLGWAGFGQQSGAAGRLNDTACLPRYPMAAHFAGLDGFPLKAASLPFPVLKIEAPELVLNYGIESVIVGAEAPALKLTLGQGSYRSDQLTAYASGQGPAQLEWLDPAAGLLEIQAPDDILPGRSRYNLTAPAKEHGRWYWFSYTWIAGERHRD